jgi:hypothetical protein
LLGYLPRFLVLDGEKTVKTLESRELTYNFVIKNTGYKPIGGMTADTMIRAELVPKSELIEISIATMGFNLYEEKSLGGGKGGTPILEPNQEGEYSFSFGLGAKEKYQENIKLAPSPESLDRIKKCFECYFAFIHWG